MKRALVLLAMVAAILEGCATTLPNKLDYAFSEIHVGDVVRTAPDYYHSIYPGPTIRGYGIVSNITTLAGESKYYTVRYVTQYYGVSSGVYERRHLTLLGRAGDE